jgi:NADH-quinone oxidoreductase subunit E
MKKIDTILKRYDHSENSIIQILTEIQDVHNYLPRDILEYVSRRLKIPFSKIYSIATFYAAFSLEPRGEHSVLVCTGTACFVRGAANVLSRAEDRLCVKAGCTTPDRQFTLETVNCLGACALAPIVVVDGHYHGQTSVQKVDTILDKYEQEKAPEEETAETPATAGQ